ncbi:NAD(P)/FAD-dependent oxidoreductase [Burkholderia gladioli]|uniref:FAD dependent oxidoreductase family protein n=1 Tax=Burkholderia gladioli TaxID=28095 RepID=A0AAW7RL05_BURGA|nr:FAD/NAD(P)-binding oxidoreductase [Burkholderia gladioli]AJW96534.1 FAD dependent oxidoreductase family protein [Burkholderia gladioli]ASD82953.1 NAD(P)/FAD-dependent oxidoreductase [Burkholderia gladioli pv. gladioli]AWY50389.1 NAD(P)/FAD-dependent oxidoreductase [Burkholderia gladioli pv. gladioli]KGC13221.1 FAD dependent oxidoreductase family protein [Burkholderia gladioli]MBJ9679673.1 NAD(P)/FAD-dependent oxidoreductase [Burkholderia gladioli]
MKAHYEIVVVGAGPAGLAAARAAAGAGARVAILDDNPRAGGQIWRQGPVFEPAAPLVESLAALRASSVELIAGARVVAALPGRELLVEQASAEAGGAILGYDKLIVATGARELLLPFAGWTLPGVTGAGGLQALVKGGVPVRGERIVIAGSGPLLIAALATAREAGANVLAVVEQASARAVRGFALSLAATPSKLVQAARLTRGFIGVDYLTGGVLRAAHGSARVEAATIEIEGRPRVIECDRIACGYGLVPNLTLPLALGCELRDGAVAVDARQRTSREAVFAAGESTGIGGMELARAEGALAGLAAAGVDEGDRRVAALMREREVWRGFAARVARTFALGDAARALPPDDTVLCRCEDVTLGAARGYADARDAKLQTRCGMGACQGRVCGAAGAALLGWQEAAIPRPPFSPVRIGTLAALAADEPLL